MEASNANTFVEISDLARVIASGYPKTAKQFQNERRSAEAFENCRPDEPGFDTCKKYAEEERRYARKSRDNCVEWREDLSRLALLVARHLPEFDGTLCHVVICPEWWEDKPIAQWEPLLIELRRIEAVAIRAAYSVDQPADDEKPRLSVDRENGEIIVDDVRHLISDPDALTLFQGMIESYPRAFHATKQDPPLRPRDINARLPKSLRKQETEGDGRLWTSGRGTGGCRLLIDPKGPALKAPAL